uniref:Uncharacterized protein n=1 Tax=Rhizophora mucronata TaxID=61149 RepID=A0A2P2KAQ3_RHIMU
MQKQTKSSYMMIHPHIFLLPLHQVLLQLLLDVKQMVNLFSISC